MNAIATIPTLLSVADLREYLIATEDHDIFAGAPPVNVDDIADRLGIVVSEEMQIGDMETVGKITLEKGEPARVWINPLENTYAPRRRFTLAHEIGHFCMHRATDQLAFVDTKATMNRSESFWNRYESEANNFAAELLMPAGLIKSVGRNLIDIYKEENHVQSMPMQTFAEQIASRFKVSNPAMAFRLKNLGIKGK